MEFGDIATGINAGIKDVINIRGQLKQQQNLDQEMAIKDLALRKAKSEYEDYERTREHMERPISLDTFIKPGTKEYETAVKFGKQHGLVDEESIGGVTKHTTNMRRMITFGNSMENILKLNETINTARFQDNQAAVQAKFQELNDFIAKGNPDPGNKDKAAKWDAQKKALEAQVKTLQDEGDAILYGLKEVRKEALKQREITAREMTKAQIGYKGKIDAAWIAYGASALRAAAIKEVQSMRITAEKKTDLMKNFDATNKDRLSRGEPPISFEAYQKFGADIKKTDKNTGETPTFVFPSNQ